MINQVVPFIEFGARPRGCPDPADVRSNPPDPADVPCRAAGLDLQSRPIEYKDFQS